MPGCPQPQPKRKPRAVSSFLKKTYQLLNDGNNQDVVRWASNGIGFIVVNQEAFSKEILPKYFKHSNYSSFVRQLNMYNFHKIRESNSESYFHHENFDRYNQAKLVDIKRKPEKKKRKNEESDEEGGSQQEERELTPQQYPFKKVKVETQMVEKRETARVEVQDSQKKIESQKNTHHFCSQEHNQSEQINTNWQGQQLNQLQDDKISINNQISQRIMPRIATRELIYPSNNNLFPFGGGHGQTSTFCLFY